MHFQVALKNNLEGKDLKMCDNTDNPKCTGSISSSVGRVKFPKDPPSPESVKIFTTAGGQPMGGGCKIELEENFDKYKFSSGGATVLEITHHRSTVKDVIRFSGGTTDWELLIFKPTKDKKHKQTTNVTIGDDKKP
ncbi:MAG: hypothetical protein JSV88_09995 [Candidatus Aminicenantes bacterium]|nr:MAG: hypothetical protein JSV88_09995 [Candidatus Aminicenantes bacterium]